MQYVAYVHSLYFLQKAHISTKTTKNHKKSSIFRCFKFLKTHKTSFKNGLTFVFNLVDISKSIQKIQI